MDNKDNKPNSNMNVGDQDNGKRSHKSSRRSRRSKQEFNSNNKPAPSVGGTGEAIPNPGDGEVFKGGTGKGSGGSHSEPAAEVDARAMYKQDPSWAQTNPLEFAAAFNPTFSNYEQVKHGAKFPWNLSEFNGVSIVDGTVCSAVIEQGTPADNPYQLMIIDVSPTCGEIWYPEQYGLEYQPMVDLGRLLYQAISARKRAALPVDALSISAYMIAFQSIIMLRSYIRLILAICSIVESSDKNVIKRNIRLLQAFFSDETGAMMATGEMGSVVSTDYWINAVGSLNAIDGLMNDCMSPPDLPLYKRAEYLFSHIITEYTDDEMSNFYVLRPSNLYQINWVGDENGTYLEPVTVGSVASLSTLIGKYRSMVSAFIGRAVGADDPNNIQAALKYVFSDKIKFDLWESVTYTTITGKEETAPVRSSWNDVLANGVDCHTWLHNLRPIPDGVLPLDISYDESFKGIRQHWTFRDDLESLKNALSRRTPLAFDFEFGMPTSDDLYEASTLAALYKVNPDWHYSTKITDVDSKGKEYEKEVTYSDVLSMIDEHRQKFIYHDKGKYTTEELKHNAAIRAEIKSLRAIAGNPLSFSFGTEVVTDVSVMRVDADLTAHWFKYHMPFVESEETTYHSVDAELSAVASFAHRPLRLVGTYNPDAPYEVSYAGCDYDTYALCPMRESDLDRMHWTCIKSYFGISNKDTLSWITPRSNYNDLDKS